MNKLIASVFAFSALCFAAPAAHAIQASIADPAALAEIAAFRRDQTAKCEKMSSIGIKVPGTGCVRRFDRPSTHGTPCAGTIKPSPKATCLANMEAKIKAMLTAAPRTPVVAPN